MNNFATTIAAISTPPGKGGVAIIRISGADALKIGSKIFKPASNKDFAEAVPRMQVRGNIYYRGELIDDGMATYFKAPFSYTGEDTVEIACHGGMLVTQTVLEAVLFSGAIPATAGEFTRRAFINGKLSLTEAEAIGNLLEAESQEQIKLSSAKSRKILSDKILEIRKSLTSLLSSIYARIDYPDEDLGDFSDGEAIEILKDVSEKIKKLLATYETGRAITEGIKTVICGKPNVGKSSVYNMLLGREAAIVTDIEGTTRDVLSEKISLGRVILNLSDTAGVREKTGDLVERIGIERSLDKISESELIIAVFDSSRELDKEDEKLIWDVKKNTAPKIALLNKSDLEKAFDKSKISGIFDEVIETSAKNGQEEALTALSSVVDRLFTDERITTGSDAIIASARQKSALTSALDFVTEAIGSFEVGLSQDIASSDIEKALGRIAELDGRAVSEEVVADIFSKFCVGK